MTELFFNVSSLFLRDLNEEPKAIRKRVEKDKATEKDWVTFKQNPTRFTQVSALDRFWNNVFRLVNLHCELCLTSAKYKKAGEIHASRETRRTRDTRGAPMFLSLHPQKFAFYLMIKSHILTAKFLIRERVNPRFAPRVLRISRACVHIDYTRNL